MHYIIYKISNKIDGKIYIGSHKTKNLDDNYMGSGKYLTRAIAKYGEENFVKEILYDFNSPEEMYAKEKELVNEDFLAMSNTYNLKIGGFGGFDYINSKGFIRNSSHFTTGNKRSSKGGESTYIKGNAIHSEESKQKAKSVLKEKFPNGTFNGRKHTEETKAAIGLKNSLNQRGENNSQSGTIWITDGITNKKIKGITPIPENWYKGRTKLSL